MYVTTDRYQSSDCVSDPLAVLQESLRQRDREILEQNK